MPTLMLIGILAVMAATVVFILARREVKNKKCDYYDRRNNHDDAMK